MTTLLSCALDRAGIPDHSDLIALVVDVERIVGVSYHVTSSPAASGELDHYPFAALEIEGRLHAIPLERTSSAAAAAASLELLRAAFGPAR